MSRNTRASSLSLILIGAFCATALSAAAQETRGPAQPGGKKVVLLIGIDKYKSPLLEGRRLNGCENDVKAVASLLKNFEGFPKVGDERFHILTNEQATREAILRTFDRVVGQVDSPLDLVYIHVSCHGSQTPDLDHDETDGDGMDETILAYDSRSPASRDPDVAVPDILDDEIYARLLRPLLAKTKNVVAVFDSCHSGDVGRDPLLQARWVDPVEKGVEGKEIAAPDRAGMFEQELDLVLISACESAQVAREQTFSEEGVQGIFTHFWVMKLKDLLRGDPKKPIKNEETYLSVLEQVRANVQVLPGNQRPVVQGKLKNTEFFGIKQRVPRPYILAEQQDVTVARLDGGKATGFTKGSTFGLFDPTTVDFEDTSKKVADVELFQVDDLTSLAKVRKGTLRTGLKALPGGPLRAIELVHNYEGHLFPVAVVGDRSTGPLASLVEKLAAFKQIEIVDPSKTTATLIVRRYRPPGKDVDEVRLEGKDGRVLSGPHAATDVEAVEKQVKAITGWCQWYRILDLNNPDAEESISVNLEIKPLIEVAGRKPGEYFEGEEVEFFLNLRAIRPLYVAILSLADNGEIKPLFISKQPLESGRKSMGVDRADMLKGREATRGFKCEWVKVFGSLERMPFEFLQQQEIRNVPINVGTFAPGMKGDPLVNLLMEGLGAEYKFGGPVPRTKWVTSNLPTVTRRKPD